VHSKLFTAQLAIYSQHVLFATEFSQRRVVYSKTIDLYDYNPLNKIQLSSDTIQYCTRFKSPIAIFSTHQHLMFINYKVYNIVNWFIKSFKAVRFF